MNYKLIVVLSIRKYDVTDVTICFERHNKSKSYISFMYRQSLEHKISSNIYIQMIVFDKIYFVHEWQYPVIENR